MFAQLCLATASMAGVPLEVVIVTDEIKSSKDFKKVNAAGTLPLLVDGETPISETIAICKYLARMGPDATDLLGGSVLEQVQVQQMISVAFSQISPLVSMAAHATFGILTPF